MFRPLWGGTANTGRHSRLRAIAGGARLPGRWRRSLAACGGSPPRTRTRPAGTYQVKVTKAKFPTEQRLGQTSLLRLGVRNTGEQDRAGADR